MFADYEPSYPRPFGFATSELLTGVLRAEINLVSQLLAKYPNVRKLLDEPHATVQQRTACFTLLAHRKLMEMISEVFASRHQESPALSDVESDAVRRTNNLVADDAPAWALEMHQVVERLPAHIYAELPEPLRTAKDLLNNAEQLQALTARVLDQQSKRLVQRWSKGVVKVRGPNKRKGWEQREKLYEAIRRALNANRSLQGIELCAELDRRHAPPLCDWVVRGEWRKGLTWKEAWSNKRLRSRIRRVRQEAQKRR